MLTRGLCPLLPVRARAGVVRRLKAKPKDDEFLFFGFVLGLNEFRYFRLSELEAARSLLGQTSRTGRRRSFRGRLTDVVPAPDL